MEQPTLEIDSAAGVQQEPIEELANSRMSIDNAAYETQDIVSDNVHEEPQDMEDIATHSVGRTRRGRSPMRLSEDDDFTPPASSMTTMSRAKSISRGRAVAARTRSMSQQRQQSPSTKPKKTRQRSKSRKSSASKQRSASKKPSKSRSRSRSASKGRKPATRGRRGRM